MKRFLLIALSLTSSLPAVVFQKFPFSISAQGIFSPQGRFFIGVRDAVAGNEFAVAAAFRSSTSFIGLTPKTVTLNSESEHPNPLNGAAIHHLAMLERRPVVITKADPSHLFLIEDLTQPIKVFKSPSLQDANGSITPSILALATTAQNVQFSLDPSASLAVLAAVANNKGQFDGAGSGLALAFFRPGAHAGQGPGWQLVDAKTGHMGNRAFPIGTDTPEVFITSHAANIDSQVALHFDRDFGLLYLGIRAQAAENDEAGVRSIFIAATINGKIVLKPIAPASAFDDLASLVGSRGAGSLTRIFKLSTMQTRTHLRYLIVVGGNGDDPILEQTVWSLPLVDNRASVSCGALANVTSLPVTLFSDQAPYRFLSRVFTEPATQPNHLYKMNSQEPRVGGQGILPGRITDLSVVDEAIFVSCEADPVLNQDKVMSGIFYSQPVFDIFGRIAGWTDWKRSAGIKDSSGVEYDSTAGTLWYVQKSEPSSTNEVARTHWSNGTDPVEQLIVQQFPQKEAGVQGLFDFSHLTEGFSQNESDRLSLLIATGFNKVVFIQSGKVTEGLFGPFSNVADQFISHDGTLKGFTGASVLSFTGGDLNKIGPITSAALVTDSHHGWFVVGGSGGVAVLADVQGRGWPMNQGLRSGFKGLDDSFAWKIMSSTSQVRKLFGQSGKLYVLATQSLERMSLSSQAIASNNVQSVVLHKLTKESKKSFSDLFLKGPLAILATSFGLLRSGNGVSIENAFNLEEVIWTPIELFQSVGSRKGFGPTNRLYAVQTSDNDVEDNLYVLNGSVGLSEALIFRLVVKLQTGQVTDNSVQLFPDLILRGNNTFFANLGDYRNFFVTDGSLIAVSRSSFDNNTSVPELLSPALKSGDAISTRARFPFLMLSAEARTIGQLVRNSTSGAWMVPGDFGIRLQK